MGCSLPRPALRVKGGGETILFFGRISQYSHREFLDAFSSQTPAQHHESLLTEVYNTAPHRHAKVCPRVRYSIDYLIAALVLWGLIVVETALVP